MGPAVLLSDDGSSTETAFLTDFSLRQIFDPDTPALHSCWGFFLGRHYCYVIETEEN